MLSACTPHNAAVCSGAAAASAAAACAVWSCSAQLLPKVARLDGLAALDQAGCQVPAGLLSQQAISGQPNLGLVVNEQSLLMVRAAACVRHSKARRAAEQAEMSC